MESTVGGLEAEMWRRVRRHLVISFGGFGIRIAWLVVVAGIGGAAFAGHPPVWLWVLAVPPFLLMPAVGFYSTFTNLRCPACNGLVAWQVNMQASVIGGRARKTCRHCGAHIFDDHVSSTFRQVGLTVFIVVIVLAMGSALLAVLFQR